MPAELAQDVAKPQGALARRFGRDRDPARFRAPARRTGTSQRLAPKVELVDGHRHTRLAVRGRPHGKGVS